jgi:hydrogenase maturation factor HypF (carbamoyltransferase family)
MGRACGRGFSIIPSDATPAERGRITIDSAVCADCLNEMRTESDQRYRHALINCTNCGPRYSIVHDLPYDRPLTTMAAFPMCEACAQQYADPADRRFHAQPICCPNCGPQVSLIDGSGQTIPGDPFIEAARLIKDGNVIAMKGLGGHHLVADAPAKTPWRGCGRARNATASPSPSWSKTSTPHAPSPNSPMTPSRCSSRRAAPSSSPPPPEKDHLCSRKASARAPTASAS